MKSMGKELRIFLRGRWKLFMGKRKEEEPYIKERRCQQIFRIAAGKIFERIDKFSQVGYYFEKTKAFFTEG